MKIIWILVITVFLAGIVKTILKTSKAKKTLSKGKDQDEKYNAVKRLGKKDSGMN